MSKSRGTFASDEQQRIVFDGTRNMNQSKTSGRATHLNQSEDFLIKPIPKIDLNTINPTERGSSFNSSLFKEEDKDIYDTDKQTLDTQKQSKSAALKKIAGKITEKLSVDIKNKCKLTNSILITLYSETTI